MVVELNHGTDCTPGAHFPSTAPILSLMANSGNFDPYALDKRQQQPQQQYPPIAVAAVAAPGYSQQPQAPLPYEEVPHRSSFEQPGTSAPVGSHPGRFHYNTVAPRSASVRSAGADEYGQDEPRDFTQDRHSWGVGAVPASVEQVCRVDRSRVVRVREGEAPCDLQYATPLPSVRPSVALAPN